MDKWLSVSGHRWPTREEYDVIVAVFLYICLMCFVCYHIDVTLDAGVWWRWTRYHLHYHPDQCLRYTQCHSSSYGLQQWKHLWSFSCKLEIEYWRSYVHYKSTASDINFHGGHVSRTNGGWTYTVWTWLGCLVMHGIVGVLPGQHVRSIMFSRGERCACGRMNFFDSACGQTRGICRY